MEIQSNDKIETKTKISNELNLFDDLEKSETTTEDKVNQEELNEIEDELICNNEIFVDLFVNEWNIFNDLFDLIDKYQINLSDEDEFVLRKGLELFVQRTHQINLWNIFLEDFDFAKRIFYMYFHLINRNIIQNYLENIPINEKFKRLYQIGLERILLVLRYTSTYTDLGLNDPQRPRNSIQFLSLMLNYVQKDFKASDITLRPSLDDPSHIREEILTFLWCYADKTVLVKDLIEAKCVEIMIDALKLMIT